MPPSVINTNGLMYSQKHQEVTSQQYGPLCQNKPKEIKEVEIHCPYSQVKKHFRVADVTLQSTKLSS